MKRNKYHVAPPHERTARGRVYASKAEKMYADILWADLGILFDDLVEQPCLWLGVPENKYRPDFFVIPKADVGRPYYVDVKGVSTPAFNKVKKLWAAYGRLDLVIVVRKGKGFEISERITPATRQTQGDIRS